MGQQIGRLKVESIVAAEGSVAAADTADTADTADIAAALPEVNSSHIAAG